MKIMQKTLKSLSAVGLYSILMIALINPQANAFDELNEAQSWIYDHNHLGNTSEGQTLSYSYIGDDGGAEQQIADKASVMVVVAHEDGRRDVEVDFLTDDRRLELPPFQGFRGNPVIIAMLEHIAQSMSTHSGGGALYFRNRIRDALASKDVVLKQSAVSVAGKEYDATSLTFYPFIGDEHLADNELMKATMFNIELSDDVPGGVISVQVSSRTEDEVFERKLLLN